VCAGLSECTLIWQKQADKYCWSDGATFEAWHSSSSMQVYLQFTRNTLRGYVGARGKKKSFAR
jgi:hypothetical protein